MTEELHLIAANHSRSLNGFELPKNYSQLLNKLEQLALGLETTFANLSIDHKALEISLNAHNVSTLKTDLSEDILLKSTGQGGLTQNSNSHQLAEEINYSRFFSDIWVGVILTLLIVSVIFFICAGFLLHKFQQWKNSYRASNPEPNIEICRHCPPMDFEAESLPSYTIVSGLPTYDDALEEFRKAGIILTPPRVPMIKIFDANGETKDPQIYNNFDSSINDLTITSRTSGDAISMTSICTCGANINNNNNNNINTNNANATITSPSAPVTHMTGNTQVIELSPEQLAQFSQKRLSLQITFNNTVRRPSRPRVDLCRAANRNNFLRLQALNNNNAGMNAATNPPSPTSQPNSPTCSGNNNNINPFFPSLFPTIHRSTSSGSLINQQQQQEQIHSDIMRLQHRGSLS